MSDRSDTAARDAWKQGPGFADGFSACRGMCDGFRGGDFTGVVEI
jgi:hypothetical protein